MKGYLDSKTEGHCVASECRVGESLKRVSSDKALRERAYGPRKMDNPSVYSACYFGEKWHIDQVRFIYSFFFHYKIFAFVVRIQHLFLVQGAM